MQKLLIIFFVYLFIPSTSLYAETSYFLMLKHNKVHVRYGPSMEYQIKYIYRKANLPLKVIDKKENFRRIIDHKNNSGWIHRTQLKKSRSLITTSEKILFKKPTKYSKPLAKLDVGRLLLIKKCEKKWCNIETEKFSGWIDKTNIWGEIN